MILHFTPNIHFTKLIKTAGKQREFNFRKIKNAEAGLFSIDVADDRGNRIVFKMQQQGAHWRLIEHDLPVWIVNVEEELSQKITEELA